MKYSQQQLQDINRRYNNIKKQIDLTNKRSQAIQSIIVDKQIPVDLLDQRNTNDIENDEFAMKALFNKYSTQILNKADNYNFEQKLRNEGLIEFFIENFPKIMQESKYYRKPSEDNIYKITLRLYNKELKELQPLETNQSEIKSQVENIDKLLRSISKNLLFIDKNVIKTQQNKVVIDSMIYKIEALRTSLNMMNDSNGFIATIFNKTMIDFSEMLSALFESSIFDNTQTEDEKIAELQTYDNDFFSLITKQSLTQALGNKSGMPNNQNNQQPNLYPINDLIGKDIYTFTDADFQILQDAIHDDNISNQQYAKLLHQITSYSEKQLLLKQTKQKMYDYAVPKFQEKIGKKKVGENQKKQESDEYNFNKGLLDGLKQNQHLAFDETEPLANIDTFCTQLGQYGFQYDNTKNKIGIQNDLRKYYYNMIPKLIHSLGLNEIWKAPSINYFPPGTTSQLSKETLLKLLGNNEPFAYNENSNSNEVKAFCKYLTQFGFHTTSKIFSTIQKDLRKYYEKIIPFLIDILGLNLTWNPPPITPFILNKIPPPKTPPPKNPPQKAPPTPQAPQYALDKQKIEDIIKNGTPQMRSIN